MQDEFGSRHVTNLPACKFAKPQNSALAKVWRSIGMTMQQPATMRTARKKIKAFRREKTFSFNFWVGLVARPAVSHLLLLSVHQFHVDLIGDRSETSNLQKLCLQLRDTKLPSPGFSCRLQFERQALGAAACHMYHSTEPGHSSCVLHDTGQADAKSGRSCPTTSATSCSLHVCNRKKNSWISALASRPRRVTVKLMTVTWHCPRDKGFLWPACSMSCNMCNCDCKPTSAPSWSL